MTKDGADLHVERWRDHWVLDKGFDDDIEAMTVRIGTIQKWFKTTSKEAVARSASRTSSTTPCTR